MDVKCESCSPAGLQGGPASAQAAEQREEAAGGIPEETEGAGAGPPTALRSRVSRVSS